MVTTPDGVTFRRLPRSDRMMLPGASVARWPPPQKTAAAPVPSAGCRLVVAEPARLVTDNADVDRPLPDACPVVTTSFAGPVALAGTVTTAPACVMTVSDDPLIVTTVPFGAVTIVPAGTFTELSAFMVMLEPAAKVTGDVEAEVEPELPDPPPQALKHTPQHTTKAARKRNCMCCSRFLIIFDSAVSASALQLMVL
ncbi:hypothetical protein BN2475_50165 [Paraburkholderia ribeironis]|uniref:Uncharacterized protein n=1 Tax=Paraburkholderia ribeironis TaxID=1247936 RepID=A0A1N7RKQ0_9BURK|nr:hypothetical protein BN2475_50165 [Paraburkholderia ribeironis]